MVVAAELTIVPVPQLGGYFVIPNQPLLEDMLYAGWVLAQAFLAKTNV
jgi:hypothetical protein